MACDRLVEAVSGWLYVPTGNLFTRESFKIIIAMCVLDTTAINARHGHGPLDLPLIVEAHGGRLWATRCEPRGALFQFTIPAD